MEDQGGFYEPSGTRTSYLSGVTSVDRAPLRTNARNGVAAEDMCIMVFKGAGTIKTTISDQNGRFTCSIIAPFANVIHGASGNVNQNIYNEGTVLARSYSATGSGSNAQSAAPTFTLLPPRATRLLHLTRAPRLPCQVAAVPRILLGL